MVRRPGPVDQVHWESFMLRQTRVWLWCLLALGPTVPALAATPTAAAPLAPVRAVEGITEYRLPNGLQVLLAPDASKPTTTVNLTYRVGSRQENYGETGMAHLLEHLLFKGTPSNPQVWAEFSKRGLRANGSTWLDRTNYFASFTANEDNLRWFLSWHADAMVNSFIARKDLDTEMTVVRNEMEMGENNPGRVLLEKTLATMYQWHNYGKSTIGARADVENVDIGRLQAFYRQYYQPDNATLIVSGKFDVAQTLAWITADFGKIAKPSRVMPQLYTLDPVQDGERSVSLHRQGGSPLVYAAYHVPPGAHAQWASVEMLDKIMTEAPAGRLHKGLVASGEAASVFSFGAALHDPGFLLFGAQLAPGQSLGKVQAELLDSLEGLAKAPVTAAELERARASWLKDWDLRFSNPETVGVALSETVALGDWRLFFLLRDRVKAVTLAEVNRVAGERFLRDNRTLALYEPTENPQRAPAPAAVDVAAQFTDYHPVEKIATVEVFDASPANIDRRTRSASVPPGLKLALLPKGARGNVVVANLSLHLGDEQSLQGQDTVASLMAAMLDKGTTQLTRQQVQDKLTALNADVRIGGGATGLGVQMVSTREHLPAVIELVGQMLRQPSFPPEVLEELRRQSLAGIEESRKEPRALLGVAMAAYRQPYPRGDVRHVSSFDEQVEDLKGVTVAQLRAFHQRFLGVAQAEFGAVGAMDEAAVQAALQQAFAGWTAPAAVQRVPQPLIQVPPSRMSFETPDKQNAVLSVALALPIQELDPDQAALMVADYAFGNGGNSRLWKRIREAEGLSYGVGSRIAWQSQDANSSWSVTAIFAPQNRAKVEAAFQEELARSLKDGFSADEISQTRSGLLNFRQLSRAQDGNLAGALANNLYLGRSFAASQALDDAIAAVTPEQALAAWRKYIHPDQLVLGVAGDFKGR
jgi:zinc protease